MKYWKDIVRALFTARMRFFFQTQNATTTDPVLLRRQRMDVGAHDLFLVPVLQEGHYGRRSVLGHRFHHRAVQLHTTKQTRLVILTFSFAPIPPSSCSCLGVAYHICANAWKMHEIHQQYVRAVCSTWIDHTDTHVEGIKVSERATNILRCGFEFWCTNHWPMPPPPPSPTPSIFSRDTNKCGWHESTLNSSLKHHNSPLPTSPWVLLYLIAKNATCDISLLWCDTCTLSYAFRFSCAIIT